MERFGFILHPLQVKDVARKFGVARHLPDSWLERILRLIPPFTVSHITGVKSKAGPEAEGWFVGCPLTARQMMALPADVSMKKVVQAAQKAQELGARIIGLGAFTAVVGDAGVTVNREVDVPVTTGNTYTVATALEGIEEAARLIGTDLDNARFAVLGATGSIGKACARILAADGRDVILVGRRPDALAEVAEEIEAESGARPDATTDLDAAVRQADAVVAVTSAIDAVIDADSLKPGAIVCDVARPRNVSRAVAEKREDVFVFEGGVVAVPGSVEFGLDFGFPAQTCYACMAETMILALEGRYEPYSLGRDLDVAKVREIRRLADKHGFALAGLRSFERAVSQEYIDRVRAALERRGGKAAAAVTMR